MLSLSDIVNVKVGIGRGVFEAPGATVIGGKKPSFNLEILKLFANGAQGFFYDPSDMTTMFQDAAGTVPVTGVGQAVGLIRDKSGRDNHAQQTTSAARPLLQYAPILGPNLVTNGDFSNGGTGWKATGTPTFTFDTGRAYYVGTGEAGAGILLNDVGMTVGKTYKISYDYEVIQGRFMVGLNLATTAGGRGIAGKGRRHFNYTVTDSRNKGVQIRPENGANYTCEFYIDNVTVQEVIGYNTAISKLQYDAVDDKLITNLPTQLTGCTVVRYVPNVGVQILTGQTIPATYEDNTNHCGLIVINRALTPSETSAITAEFKRGLVYEF